MQAPEYRPGEVLVRFRAGVSQLEKDTIIATQGARRLRRLAGESGIEKLEAIGGQDAATAALQFRLNPAVELAEPNFLIAKDEVIPSDPSFAEQWALRNTGQNGGQYGSDIGVTTAWRTTTGLASTVIAVIDSGVDFSHPDLANNQWTNPNPSQAGDLHGWDYVANNGEIKDEQGHGTAIAGIIAAQAENNIGISGVMWSASLMSLRVLDNTGTGDVANAVEAMDYAVAHGAQVINLSWGTTGESLVLKDAIERAIRRKAVVVCSAGNGGQDVDVNPYYPASFGIRNLISVAATDNFDQLASSNWGHTKVTIAAPGVNILTTQMGGGYWNVSGTSAAAPLVSGVAGLLKSLRPEANANLIFKAISDSARQIVSLSGKVSSGGVVNASAALAALPRNGYGTGSQGATPPPPARGNRGGPGPGGSFDTTPPPSTSGAPGPNLPNLDQLRNVQPEQPQPRAPIQSNLMCADCDGGGGGGGGGYPSGDPNFSTARRRPQNETGQTGVDLGSRNFNWSYPLLSLAGRAGLDINLSLSYNSLVWTKDGSNIKFNGDDGSPAPGFRLGLPTVQQRFYNAAAGVYSYLMVSPSGARIEMRQVGATNIYESQDSSYTQLTDNTSSLLVRNSDGTQLTFVPMTDLTLHGYRCTQIKDRNGNFTSATFDAGNGHLQTITDTLGRVITFVYDGSNNLQAIRQSWAGANHDWATFYYGQVWVAPAFGGGLTVNGRNNAYQTVLNEVWLHDGSHFSFEYNAAFAQVKRINHFAADAHLLAYTSYNMDASSGQTDCPRFTERRDWADDWNGELEAVTNYSVAGDNSWSQQTAPDGTIYKEFYYTTGWQTGLTSSTEVWASSVKQKWTTTAWTQDNTGLTYQKNPRPNETNIYDAAGNRRRTTISYATFTLPSGASCSLPSDIYEYQSNATSVLRRTHTDYRYDSVFMERRIIGLPAAKYLYDAAGAIKAKTLYDYDWPQWPEHLQATPQPAIRHDETNFGPNTAAGRGNVVLVQRWDATDPTNYSKVTEFKIGYWTTGAVAFTRDARGHQTNVAYSDSFSDGNNSRNTFAYPTTVTDPDGYQTTSQYNFDYAAVTRVTTPSPNSGQTAPYLTYSYDSAARLLQITSSVNSAYTRWVYPTSQTAVQTFSTVVSGAGEAYSTQILDGAGRVRATGADHPGSSGLYSGQYIIYDNMGRMSQQSNPTEMNGSWTATGDDPSWIYTLQTYDWKGRPTVTTNPDGSTRENTYGGCGCAGGEQVTVRDEGGRRRRMTMDVVGRLWKVEELNWGGGSVYSTTTYSYTVLDQILSVSHAGQIRSFGYDGYGRLNSRTTPEQGTTTYSYFNDDVVQTVTDARSATMTFSYNNRDLVTGITYGVPAGVAATPNVSFGYNAAGSRTSMTDGLGSVSYVYDQLSRLTSETRTLTGVSGSFPLNYQYNLAGEPSSVTNPWSAVVGYNYDKTGRPTTVSGSGYYGVSSYINNLSYRAFGAAKQISYANGRTLSLQYNNRLWLSRWDLPNPGGGSNSSNALGYAYSYNQWGEGNTGRPDFADSLYDSTLDRSWDYDHVGRLISAYTGKEANNIWGSPDGPYAQSYNFDTWGNITSRAGWGGWNNQYTASFNTKNQMLTNPDNGQAFSYDAAGNITYDGGQTFTYDAAGKQITSSWNGLQQGYDGDGLRGKKTMDGVTTYYLRSSVLGGQVVAEISSGGSWTRGYVYLGGQMLAVQSSGVTWVHQEPLTKGQRLTNGTGVVTSTIELDPWGGETNRNMNSAFQPHAYTSYERDTTGGIDEAQQRRYHGWWSRFDQPDPYDGSYDYTNPQSFNRYSYVQNDAVNHTDPSGLEMCYEAWCTLGGGGSYFGSFGGPGPGFSSHILDAMGGYDQRVQNSLDANRANEAYHEALQSGRAEDMARALDMIAANKTLTLIATLSQAQESALALISLLFGQAIGDQVRFDVVAQLTGLSDYIRSYTYHEDTRTFDVIFTSTADVSRFLAHSPYFAGPGIAFEHLGVGTFDYRSYTDLTGGLSLQVVPGRNSSFGYADFDRFNPYQDVWGLLRHNILDVIPHKIQRIFR